MLIKRVAADVEASVPRAFDLTGSRTVVDVRAAAIEELRQGVGETAHGREHALRAPRHATVLIFKGLGVLQRVLQRRLRSRRLMSTPAHHCSWPGNEPPDHGWDGPDMEAVTMR